MEKMAKTYSPNEIENRIYAEWIEKGLFKGKINKDKDPYTIVIPPPNVTGMLTIGHVLNNTLQDILIRRHKMLGFETCWVPGTDHASIATEAKVAEMLKNKGIDKKTIGRDEFLKYAWEWKEKYGGMIIRQLKKLGCSCDWDREKFTMNDDYYKKVIDTFIELYKQGYIYKGYRLVNWCPVSKSVISDEEVEFKKQNGKLWHFKYPVEGSDEFVIIATTRPETMLGDTAVAVHPEDKRYSHLVGKTIILPIVGRNIPVITDEYVDMEFGTGCVKITPAHDPNDYQMGKKHDLEFIGVMNKDATINEKAPERYHGLDRYVARKKIVAEMEELGLLAKIEDHENNVGYSERGKVPIEYMISEQWYLSMKKLAEPALDVVRKELVKFHPEKWVKTYFHWMDNIQDWCISRQLWWGHRIPVYYCKECSDVVMVSDEKPAVCEKCGKSDTVYQEEDVLDTWASSWIWAHGVFENKEEEDYFYPTSVLITAPDIIFFWVARMIMAGMHFKNDIPFKDVYFTGLVRDEQGRKMSKSLGNSPDPIDIIETYGADALRFTMVRLTPVGNDILFSEKKCELGRNFANKIWNAARFIFMNSSEDSKEKLHTETLEDKWILSRYHQTAKKVAEKFDSYELNEALKAIYEFLWNDFCDWYIEMAKSRLMSTDEQVKKTVVENALYIFDRALRLLHPFMPFLTEEIWQSLPYRSNNESIMVADVETGDDSLISEDVENSIELMKEIIGRVRTVRADYGISPGQELDLIVKAELPEIEPAAGLIKSLAKVGNLTFDKNAAKPNRAASFVVLNNEIYVPDVIDTKKEREKLEKEISRLDNINKGIEKKLSNERFVANAPAEVVDREREKLSNNLESLIKLRANLKDLD